MMEGLTGAELRRGPIFFAQNMPQTVPRAKSADDQSVLIKPDEKRSGSVGLFGGLQPGFLPATE
jgi:hypothetical protein